MARDDTDKLSSDFVPIASQELPPDIIENLLLRSISRLSGYQNNLPYAFYPVQVKQRPVLMVYGVSFEYHQSVLNMAVKTFCHSRGYKKKYPWAIAKRRSALIDYDLTSYVPNKNPQHHWWNIAIPKHKNQVAAFSPTQIKTCKIGKLIELIQNLHDCYQHHVLIEFEQFTPKEVKPLLANQDPKQHWSFLKAWLQDIPDISLVNYSKHPMAAQLLRKWLVQEYPFLAEKTNIDCRFERRFLNIVVKDKEPKIEADELHYNLRQLHPDSTIQCINADTVIKATQGVENNADFPLKKTLFELVVKRDLINLSSSFLSLQGQWIFHSPLVYLQSFEEEPVLRCGHFTLSVHGNLLQPAFCEVNEWAELNEQQDAFLTESLHQSDVWCIIGENNAFTIQRSDIIAMPEPNDLLITLQMLERLKINGLPKGSIECFLSENQVPSDIKALLQNLPENLPEVTSQIKSAFSMQSKWVRLFNDFLIKEYDLSFFHAYQAKGHFLYELQVPLHLARNQDELVYFCGNLGPAKQKMSHFNHFYVLKRMNANTSEKSIINMLDVTFIRENSLSALPWPIKYLREYAMHYCLKNNLFTADGKGKPLGASWL